MKSRLREILASGIAPGFDTKANDERSPEKAVPRALKQLDGNQVRKMVRESGFSVNHFKKVWDL